MTGSTLIAADKQMMGEGGHGHWPFVGSSTFRRRVHGILPPKGGITNGYLSNSTHEICVTNWLSDANDRCTFVAKRGVLLAGNVASEASPTRNTLKSFERFS